MARTRPTLPLRGLCQIRRPGVLGVGGGYHPSATPPRLRSAHLVQNQGTLLVMVSRLFPPLIKGGIGGIYREGPACPKRSPEHALGTRVKDWGKIRLSPRHSVPSPIIDE